MTDASLARRALSYELGMWRSLFRWIGGRHRGPDAFRYAGTLTPLMLAFIGVSAVELPILHLLLPWPAVRLIVDLLSVYGLLWMLGMLASHRVHPHLAGESGLRIRQGTTVDLAVPWADVATVRARNRGVDKRGSVLVEPTDAGTVLVVSVLKQTNVDVELRRPTRVGEHEDVVGLRLYVDDPAALVTRARQHLLP